MKGNQTQKLLHQAIEDLAKALGAGQSESLRRFLTAMARFHHYSLANMFLIMIQRPTATQVAGYRTWQKHGRQVKKGEKGIAILAPIVYRRKLESEQNGVTEDKVEEILTTFKTVFVFDDSQTEGRPLPELARVSGNPVELLPQLRDFVARKAITLRYSAALDGVEGLSTGRQIILKQGLPPGQEFSVLVHELAHGLLHRDGAERDSKVKELEAEAVACVVCEACGLAATASSNDYIQLHQGDRDMLMASLERIKRTAVEIINGLHGVQEVDNLVAPQRAEIPLLAAA